MGMDAAGMRWGAPGRAASAPCRCRAAGPARDSQPPPPPGELRPALRCKAHKTALCLLCFWVRCSVLPPSLLQQAVLKCRLARLLRRGAPRVSFSCCAFGYRAAHPALLKQTCSHAGTGELHSPHIHVDVRAVSCATS